MKSLKQPAIPLRTIQQQKKKQQQITEFIDDSQNESDKTTEVFRMIVKICELFKNRFTFPQVLATIHCCAGDVERAISILKDSGPLGDAETLLDPSKIDAPKQLKDEYFQV